MNIILKTATGLFAKLALKPLNMDYGAARLIMGGLIQVQKRLHSGKD